jgi:hypothetical protein
LKHALLVGSLVVALANTAAAQGSEVYTRLGENGSHFNLAADTQTFLYEATVSASTLAYVATLEVFHNGVLKATSAQAGAPLIKLNFAAQVDMSAWGLASGDQVTFRLNVVAVGLGQLLASHTVTGNVGSQTIAKNDP